MSVMISSSLGKIKSILLVVMVVMMVMMVMVVIGMHNCMMMENIK